MRVEPGSNNVIPHAVTFNLDLRSHDDDTIAERLARITARFDEIARQEGVDVQVEQAGSVSGPPFDTSIRQLLGGEADERGVHWSPVRGHIGHDSLHLGSMGPAAMIFTQTQGGRSHCEEEFAPWESVLATAEVYANAGLALAHTANLADLDTDNRG